MSNEQQTDFRNGRVRDSASGLGPDDRLPLHPLTRAAIVAAVRKGLEPLRAVRSVEFAAVADGYRTVMDASARGFGFGDASTSCVEESKCRLEAVGPSSEDDHTSSSSPDIGPVCGR